jgi:hypothetical protein
MSDKTQMIFCGLIGASAFISLVFPVFGCMIVWIVGSLFLSVVLSRVKNDALRFWLQVVFQIAFIAATISFAQWLHYGPSRWDYPSDGAQNYGG